MRALALVLLLVAACPSQPGDTCRQHSDCKLKGSYCARAEICTLGCDGGGPCPSGAACVSVGVREVCLETCTVDKDCPTDFACREVGAEHVCMLADPLAKPR